MECEPPSSADLLDPGLAVAYARLLAFAKGPGELLAVSRPANRAKRDADASQWLPRAAARCDYAARQLA